MISEFMLSDARKFRNEQLGNMVFDNRMFPGDPGQYVIQHCNRVEHLVIEIGERENVHDLELIQLAAILHDIGKIEGHENHAYVGADMARSYLEGKLDPTMLEKVVNLIRQHSDKKGLTLDQMILDDADLLDETGAMGVLMQVSRVPFKESAYYEKVIEGLNNEQRFHEKIYRKLKTHTGKSLMREKMKFVKNFTFQLERELKR